MKILSIRQPWASLIVSGLKDVENRDARLQHVKALGRVAYRFLRTSEIEGRFTSTAMTSTLANLKRTDCVSSCCSLSDRRSPTEYSEIQIFYEGRKVFDIRWDKADHFKARLYQPRERERILLDWPELYRSISMTHVSKKTPRCASPCAK